MQKMKIGIVSPHSPSDDAIGEYCEHLAEELCQRTELVVFANKSPSHPKSINKDCHRGQQIQKPRHRFQGLGWIDPQNESPAASFTWSPPRLSHTTHPGCPTHYRATHSQ